MAINHKIINFYISEPDEILQAMQDLRKLGDGKGWMNLIPWLEDVDVPRHSPLGKMFSAKGPGIPQSTWVPASPNAKKPKDGNLGILHPAGRFAVRQLKEGGVEVPSRLTLKQDHPRRGLVFILDTKTEEAELLNFMVAASKFLSEVQIEDRWVADILKQS